MSGTGGWDFCPRTAAHCPLLYERSSTVEQRFPKPSVGGSNPSARAVAGSSSSSGTAVPSRDVREPPVGSPRRTTHADTRSRPPNPGEFLVPRPIRSLEAQTRPRADVTRPTANKPTAPGRNTTGWRGRSMATAVEPSSAPSAPGKPISLPIASLIGAVYVLAALAVVLYAVPMLWADTVAPPGRSDAVRRVALRHPTRRLGRPPLVREQTRRRQPQGGSRRQFLMIVARDRDLLHRARCSP